MLRGRITNRLRWHKKETTDAEDTRVNLESWLPKDLHRTINHVRLLRIPYFTVLDSPRPFATDIGWIWSNNLLARGTAVRTLLGLQSVWPLSI